MALFSIRVLPDPVLRQRSKRVRYIDGSVLQLVGDMLETLRAADGVGLAAPQIGIPLRVVVIGIPDEKEIVLINPEIVRRRGERLVDEGCLSIPGYVGQIRRAQSVTVKARDQQGKEMRIKASDLLAQALEHEIDHLNGVLYIDRLDSAEYLHRITPDDSEPRATPIWDIAPAVADKYQPKGTAEP